MALAAHLLPLADGSDMMGSLRNPASWNHVYGFRPSMGRVPFGPTPEMFFQQLGYEGPMARKVADLAMPLSTEAVYDPGCPVVGGRRRRIAAPLTGTVKGARIGWLGDLGGHLATQPGVPETCEAALGIFAAMGCSVAPVKPAFAMERLWSAWVTLRSLLVSDGMAALYDNPKARDLLKPEAVWG